MSVYTQDRPGDSPDFQDSYTAHRVNVTTADTYDLQAICSPGGYALAPAVFDICKAQSVEMRLAANVDDTNKTILVTVVMWREGSFDHSTAQHIQSSGYVVLDSAFAPSGQQITGHPFGGDSTASGIEFFMADAETETYAVDGQVLRYPNTVANAAGRELRILFDGFGMSKMAVLIDGVPSASRVEVGLARVG